MAVSHLKMKFPFLLYQNRLLGLLYNALVIVAAVVVVFNKEKSRKGK